MFIGIAERNVMVLFCTLQEHENKKEIVYKFIEEEMKILNPCDSIEFQIIHRAGKTKHAGPGPRARFLCYADHEISTFHFKTAIIISPLIFLIYPTISHFS